MTQGIDVDKLEKELISALEADKKYSRENDAKFRAVHQKVGSYDEFRDIVKASHLAPLDRDDITGRKGRKQPWNPVASTTTPVVDSRGAESTTASSTPSNIQTFVREWRKRKSSKQDQYQFLMQFESHQIDEIFKIEVSVGLLGELLDAMNTGFVVENVTKMVEFLEVWSRSSRFSLSLSFLSTTEKAMVGELFMKIRNVLASDAMKATTEAPDRTFVDLCAIYDVTF